MNKIINTDPYGNLICQWFKTKFPKEVTTSKSDLLEILSDLIYSTKENRLGPIPSPEYQVVVRDVIRRSIELDHPIPVLLPWGGRKTKVCNSLRLDMAEVSGLYQIIDLDNQIKKYYSPGLMVNVRVEDVGANWLYRSEEDIYRTTDRYSTDFVLLINMLKGNMLMTGIREIEVMQSDEYMKVSASYSDLIKQVILKQMARPNLDVTHIEEFQRLLSMGWQGKMPEEQMSYYLNRYQSLYPGKPMEDYITMLSDYWGGSKARYDLNGKCDPKTPVNGFIQLTYTPPVPGAPASLFSNAVYWRTVPMSSGRTHISPWRGKGYMKICGNDSKVKITSFGDEITKQLIPSITVMEANGKTLEIDTDYLLG